MKKITYLSALAIAALVFSCKKDDDKSTSELLLGKWNETSWTDNDFYNNEAHRDTGTYAMGTHSLEFLNSGKVIENGPGYSDTMSYKLDGSKIIVESTYTLTINSISGSELQLYSKEMYSNNAGYYELTSNYKK